MMVRRPRCLQVHESDVAQCRLPLSWQARKLLLLAPSDWHSDWKQWLATNQYLALWPQLESAARHPSYRGRLFSIRIARALLLSQVRNHDFLIRRTTFSFHKKEHYSP